jgi:sugar phosphate isomerase/epimerase
MHNRISINHLCFMSDAMPTFAQHLRALGAQRVSLIGPYLLADGGPEAAQSLLELQGCQLETITHPFQSGKQLSTREEDWMAPRARLSRLIEIAAQLGARSIYMVTGGHGSLEWNEAARSFADAIAPCVAQSEAAGIQLMIETTNPFYADIHLAHSLRDTIKLAEIANIGVCIDLFTCWAEADLKPLIAKALPKCRAVQFSDYIYGDRSILQRAVPGDGVIPLERLVGWVLEAGYTGAFDLELGGPRIREEGELAAVRRAAAHMTEVLYRLGVSGGPDTDSFGQIGAAPHG